MPRNQVGLGPAMGEYYLDLGCPRCGQECVQHVASTCDTHCGTTTWENQGTKGEILRERGHNR